MKFKIILVVISLIVGLLLGEIILRLLNLPPELNYKYKNISIAAWMKKYNNLNSMKYRDTEHDFNKPDQTYRIFYTGDSFTYGLFIDNPENVFPKIIEKELQKKSTKKIETINSARPGNDIFDEVKKFSTDGVKFHPDLVVLGLNFDEANVKHVPLDDPNIKIPVWIKTFRVYQVVIGSYLRSQAEIKYRNYMLSIYKNEKMEDWKIFEDQLLKLKKDADSVNARVAIVLFTPIYPRQPDKPYDFYQFNNRMKEFGKNHNIIIIDPLKKVLDDKNKEELVVSPLDAHPTVKMNELIAESFIEQFPESLVK